MVAQKYGISLSSSVSAIMGCRYPADCTHVEVHTVRGLSGHRDYNSTACPGTNVYSELIGLVSKLDQSRVPIFNPESFQIDPLPTDEVMNMTLKVTQPPVNQTLSVLKNIPKKSPKSPIVKIRLSYS